MKALFFVEAPFQLLSAYEALETYCIDEFEIYIRLSNSGDNDIQLKKLAETLFHNDDNIIYISISVKNRTLLDYLKVLSYCLYSFIIQVKYDFIFIGNYESKFLSLLLKPIQKRKVVLLDDGIKSISLQKKFSDSNNFNLYTMLKNLKPLNNQIIRYNNFSRFNKFRKDNDIVYEESILFIGSKLSEAKITTEKYYIELLGRISKYYKNKQIIYVPHRGENKDKLDTIASILNNIVIKDLNYPVEFYFFYEKSMPLKVVSFYSAALVTISQLYPAVEVTSFYFDYSNSKYKDDIDEIYDYFKNYIEVVKLYD